jgi:hypothetical protein
MWWSSHSLLRVSSRAGPLPRPPRAPVAHKAARRCVAGGCAALSRHWRATAGPLARSARLSLGSRSAVLVAALLRACSLAARLRRSLACAWRSARSWRRMRAARAAAIGLPFARCARATSPRASPAPRVGFATCGAGVKNKQQRPRRCARGQRPAHATPQFRTVVNPAPGARRAAAGGVDSRAEPNCPWGWPLHSRGWLELGGGCGNAACARRI